jgi:hypothetical protein
MFVSNIMYSFFEKMFENLNKRKHWYQFVGCIQICSWLFLVIASRSLYVTLKCIRYDDEDNLHIGWYTCTCYWVIHVESESSVPSQHKVYL